MSRPIFAFLFSIVNTNHVFLHAITANYISLYQPHPLLALSFICKGHDVSAAQASARAHQDRLIAIEKSYCPSSCLGRQTRWICFIEE